MIKEVKCNTFKNCEIVVAQNVELTRKTFIAFDNFLREPSMCETAILREN